MNDQFQDKTIIIIILSTILLVFLLVFSFKSNKIEQERTIYWMDSSINNELITPT